MSDKLTKFSPWCGSKGLRLPLGHRLWTVAFILLMFVEWINE